MMKKEMPKEIPAEFIALFGKPISLDNALSKPQKSAYKILQDEKEATEAAKRQGEVK